jgi:putative ABC transport system permease protein
LPPATQVFDRRRLEDLERHYWMSVKPIGIMFTSGILIAGLVAGVILYQILSTQVRNHLGGYATLEAIGWTPNRIRALVVEEGLVFALLGYVVASAGAGLLYKALREATGLPMDLTIESLVTVLLLTLLVATVASLLAVRQLGRADPAELF